MSAPTDPGTKPSSRITCIDALRGLVMIIMALDHIRDFFHAGAMSFFPTDLSRTTPILFFARWVTHFCLPVFVLCAGIGAFLFGQRTQRPSQLSQFLWTRGLWFVVLELTVMQLAYNFTFSLRFPILLLILWIFGICMMAMAALIHLPVRWLAGLSIAILLFHNCLDGVDGAKFGSAALVWNLLHQPGFVSVAGKSVLVTYTLLPWIAVMAAGFCLGQIFLMEPAARQRILLRLGLALTVAFIVVRGLNLYGDPVRWSHQKSWVFTMLSFLNCTKYPGSLDFVLMTLGPSLLMLAYLDRRTLKDTNPLIVFGRVPLFYFILHFYVIHALTVLAALLRYGVQAGKFMFNPLPSMGGPSDLFPANFGYRLWVVYAVWILTVTMLYPLCRWFAKVKRERAAWWLSYL